MAIAYLSDGKLFLKRDGQSAELIESHFAQESLDRSQRSRQRTDWKGKGEGSSMMAGPLLWGARGKQEELRRIRMTGITAGPNAGQLVYALDMDAVGGLFVYDARAGHEQRLFHRTDFTASDLHRHPTEPRVALSVRHADGSANIGLVDLDKGARGLREVTEGDSLDEAPAWVRGAPSQQIIFQSAGIGRNEQGAAIALGNYAIQKVDVDSGHFETLLDDEKYDYLLPRVAVDGSLYFIRRPYNPDGVVHVSGWKLALDMLLFPLRVVYGLVIFLNFLTMTWSKKPLLTAGGPKRDGMERRDLIMWGKRLDAEKALKDLSKDKTAPLVPRDWQLMLRAPSGEETTVAEAVLGFDLSDDGTVIYTNGSAIFQLTPSGERTTVCNDHVIRHVAMVTV